MPTFDLSVPDEVRLTLRGAAENIILGTVRRWPHWMRADLEHSLEDPAHCVAVTLVAERGQEATIREILQRGFGLRFPLEGGSLPFALPAAPPSRRRA